MNESAPQRLASAHMQDAIFLFLSARPDGQKFDLYPDIDDAVRARLRSRLKQIARYDWPSSLRKDPSLKRGYTLPQCFRLMIVLQLLDAHLPPPLAIAIAQNNEPGFFSAIARRLSDSARFDRLPNDSIAIISPGEMQESFGFPGWAEFEAERVHFLPRNDLSMIWSGDLPAAGARLAIDVGSAAITLWRWISGRRLMSDTARTTFIAENNASDKDLSFKRVAERPTKR